MAIAHGLERVIVIPRNGYVNRLQAWASSAILAAELDVPLAVHWEPEPIAPAAAEVLFADRVRRMGFIDAPALESVLGSPHAELPRYLTVLQERGVLVLAGHDRGEQAFMGDLDASLRETRLHTLVIIAGGKFHLPGTSEATSGRRSFYRQLAWSEPIASRVEQLIGQHRRYLGLHLRATDRAREAPTGRQVREALAEIRERTSERSLFIASDTPTARMQWVRTAEELGFTPWTADIPTADRALPDAAIPAMVDWITLGHSTGIVYSAASSFGEEAAVAADAVETSIPLTASASMRRLRDARRLARDAITAPARRMRD